MKTFAELKEKLAKHPAGEMVFNKKVKNVPVMIHKEKSEFVVYIDGDRLDSYKTQKQAEQSATQIVSQLKGK